MIYCSGEKTNSTCMYSFRMSTVMKLQFHIVKTSLANDRGLWRRELLDFSFTLRVQNYSPDIFTPFFWRSPHDSSILRVPDKIPKVFAPLPARPLLLQGGHDEGLCRPQSIADFLFPLLSFFLSTFWRHSNNTGCFSRQFEVTFNVVLVYCTHNYMFFYRWH